MLAALPVSLGKSPSLSVSRRREGALTMLSPHSPLSPSDSLATWAALRWTH